MNRAIAMFVMLACVGTLAHAQSTERGQGGIVITDAANVYAKSTGEDVKYVLKRGEAVTGSANPTTAFFSPTTGTYLFAEKDGRVRVMYFEADAKRPIGGWMKPADLQKFTYTACGRTATPFAGDAFKQKWNPCFEEARDAALQKIAEHQ